MKGLVSTAIIILVLIAAGAAMSLIMSANLSNRVAVARERGYEVGMARGYPAGFQEGSRAGYQEGSKIGYDEGRGYPGGNNEKGFYFTCNPTFDEVQHLLAEAKVDSAMKLNEYAEANGVRTAYVRCEIARQFSEGTIYMYELVAFETVERGLIIIEPWSHREVKVEVGRSYSQLNGVSIPHYDDTITKIVIVW